MYARIFPVHPQINNTAAMATGTATVSYLLGEKSPAAAPGCVRTAPVTRPTVRFFTRLSDLPDARKLSRGGRDIVFHQMLPSRV